MYDTIHLRIQSPAPYIAFQNGRLPLQSVGSTASGGVFGALRNARVALSAHCATFKGSISKFYTNSKSQQYLSREQVADALSAIALLFDVEESKMQVTRFDVAFNLVMTESISEYMKRMLAPADFNPAKWEGETLYFTGKKGSVRENIQLCIYDKSGAQASRGQAGAIPNLLRLEMRVSNVAKIVGQSLPADALYYPQNWANLLVWWRNYFYNIPMMKEIRGLTVETLGELKDAVIAEKIARGEEEQLRQMIEAMPQKQARLYARKKYEELLQRFELVESEEEQEYRDAVRSCYDCECYCADEEVKKCIS